MSRVLVRMILAGGREDAVVEIFAAPCTVIEEGLRRRRLPFVVVIQLFVWSSSCDRADILASSLFGRFYTQPIEFIRTKTNLFWIWFSAVSLGFSIDRSITSLHEDVIKSGGSQSCKNGWLDRWVGGWAKVSEFVKKLEEKFRLIMKIFKVWDWMINYFRGIDSFKLSSRTQMNAAPNFMKEI